MIPPYSNVFLKLCRVCNKQDIHGKTDEFGRHTAQTKERVSFEFAYYSYTEKFENLEQWIYLKKSKTDTQAIN